MDDVSGRLALAAEKCEKRNARLTNKRKAVLSVMLESNKALSAYEMIERFEKRFDEQLRPMSAYRILDFLESMDLIHRLNIANKFVACSHITCDSEHELSQFLVCQKCQRVEEVALKKAKFVELNKNITQAGFRLVSPQIEFNCICPLCA
ncbi:Fur family transcriptional regulator [Thalassotalea euphylliae]|uniref:Fur family transcriptional regulator n=1 Tax=Thalassotalea euphylliae TaxID=1655234 RepID=UPI00364109B0